jgi:dipeptidyl aminopeptidase/acylaminoacyl peptidase
LQPNYRGSAGYGEGFEGLGNGQIGRAMQDDLDDGMDWLVKEGTVDAKRVCVSGSSYGGYAALWAVIRNPERYRCAASFAGVTDWKRQLKYQNNQESDGSERSKWSRKVRGGDDGKFDLDLVSPAKQAARLTRPVLLAHGDKDTRVPFSQYKSMVDASAKANVPLEAMVIIGEGHGFDKPENEAKWYTALETFLQKHNPAD